MSKTIAMAVAFLGTVGLLLSPQDAKACSCFPSSVASSYQNYDLVVRVRVGRKLKSQDSFTLRYQGKILDAFKGCVSGDIVIETGSNGAMCGLDLSRGEWLLNATVSGVTASGTQTVSVNLCGYNRTWSSLYDSDLEYLYSRTNCCKGGCVCTDGSLPVQCFAQPCSVSSCDVEGATCQDNYCDGCGAEWYTAFGDQVCNDECQVDTDCSADTWCRQNEVGTLECVPFVGAGGSCEGFTLPWYYERCAAGLQCVTEPYIADAPGICATCDYNGTPYMAGDSFDADDGCNTCFCGENGLVGCTKIACVDKPKGKKGPKCGDAQCNQNQVCCNASCGICTPPDGVCTQQACSPTSL